MFSCFKKGKKLQRKRAITSRGKSSPHPVPTADESGPISYDVSENPISSSAHDADAVILSRKNTDEYEWSGGHRLSDILESLEEESRRNTLHSDTAKDALSLLSTNAPRLQTLNRDYKRLSGHLRVSSHHSLSNMSEKGASAEAARPIEAPPKDLESISRIDASLVFEHFTTDDAWALGSALRNRLMPISTPVVINISLANQNQTLFHTCTHSGVMPDNDSWVARKRKTVLRWGCSTWYMHCKFEGDEKAFAEKNGLGGEAGSYAIHGGGVPIRVVGVEGVVAVVVVSGLKQHEDHAVIVEVIKELRS